MAPTGRSTVFIGTPLDMADAMLPLHRLLFAVAPAPADRPPSDGCATARRKRRKLLMLLDEFPSLGRLPAMERNMANLAGYGVRALLCAQDEVQVTRVYGENHALAANCRLRIFSASLSEQSLKREQALAGSEPVVRRGGSRSGPWFGRRSSSWSEGAAPLVETGELMALSLSHVVVFAPGLRRPVVLPKIATGASLFPRPVREREGSRASGCGRRTAPCRVRRRSLPPRRSPRSRRRE